LFFLQIRRMLPIAIALFCVFALALFLFVMRR